MNAREPFLYTTSAHELHPALHASSAHARPGAVPARRRTERRAPRSRRPRCRLRSLASPPALLQQLLRTRGRGRSVFTLRRRPFIRPFLCNRHSRGARTRSVAPEQCCCRSQEQSAAHRHRDVDRQAGRRGDGGGRLRAGREGIAGSQQSHRGAAHIRVCDTKSTGPGCAGPDPAREVGGIRLRKRDACIHLNASAVAQ